LAFLLPRKSRSFLKYPWPLGEFDNVKDVALDIPMDYLDRTGQAVRFNDAQSTARNGDSCGVESWRPAPD
jgi:hypothetical protein